MGLKNLQYFAWLKPFIKVVTNAHVVPTNPLKELEINPDKPICYVLSRDSLSDVLLLDKYLEKLNLPRPTKKLKDLHHGRGASYFYLAKTGVFQVQREFQNTPPPLDYVLKRATEDRSFDVQLVPVSVFWGRDPGRDEKSLLKLLFFDDDHAGIVQKSFIVLAQGRNSFIHFGKPILLQSMIESSEKVEATAKKLRRVMRVHFRRQRTATLGPTLYVKSQAVARLLKSPAVVDAIKDEARRKNQSIHHAEQTALSYALELASDTSPNVIRFFDTILTRLWNNMYSGVKLEKVERFRELSQEYEIIYASCHRSHLDYLLLTYVIYHAGLNTPQIVAGVNLNIWIVGPLLRKAGAFFIRRSFKGNRLYTAVVQEYLSFLISRGHSILFFPEGGRSRNGKTLAPKMGMLSMMMQAFVRGVHQKPVAIVPVSISYDKVVEVQSYVREMQGNSKKKESFLQVLKMRKLFKSFYGQACVGVAEPIFLEKYLDEKIPDWRSVANHPEDKPAWLSDVVDDLSYNIVHGINEHSVVTPTAVVASALLSRPEKAFTEKELGRFISSLSKIVGHLTDISGVVWPTQSPAEMMRISEKLNFFQRYKHADGDVIFLEGAQALNSSYYRNNIIHFLAPLSVAAGIFRVNQSIEKNSFLQISIFLLKILSKDLFFPRHNSIQNVIDRVLQTFIAEGMIVEKDDQLEVAKFESYQYVDMMLIAHLSQNYYERYTIALLALLKMEARRQGGLEKYKEGFTLEELEKDVRTLYERLTLLKGVRDQEAAEKDFLKNFILTIKDEKMIQAHQGNRWIVTEVGKIIAMQVIRILPPEWQTHADQPKSLM